MNQTVKWQDVIVGDRYQLKSLLGQGGMSQVYLAEDQKLKGKRWAVKACTCTDSDKASFMEEAEMLAKLGHAQLPQLVDYFINNDGIGYLVMDYIEGPTLQDMFDKQHCEIPIGQIVQIAFQLLDIFHYLHTFRPRPIIYRDLKPSNVMLNEHHQVRLIDFGVARQFKQGQASDTMQMGTIGFAAPEQYLGQQTDARTDLYTLGSMLYYLLSGGHYAYISQKPLELINEKLSKPLTAIIHVLLQEDPQNRFQSALEVKLRLRSLYPETWTSKGESQPLSLTSPAISDQLIVIGGLFAGVGATFTGISLARILHALHIPHAYVEQPTIEPDLYMRLYGERHAPNSYVFPSALVHDASTSSPTPWNNGFTTWVPIHPDGFQGTWHASDSFKLLHMIKKPIVLWDVSTQWEHPAVQELCHSADAIIVVIDSLPGKCDRPSSRRHLQLFETHQLRGKKVHYIANGPTPTQFRREWQESLPSMPTCTMPEIPRANVKQAIIKGECIQDQPLILKALFEAAQPILREILPEMTDNPLHQHTKKTWFSRFNKRA
ncbi:hypothetical protein A8709_25945 [Paenibacillus pectinilyticus]|uniref:non-specific serine/threonine protein kinase n=1 Tax=Paenibacillus pectinilyticus TaxID=512399 RepID=A0A1C1A185_9BACL|nr:serine/threonine-protein kinase [Paenibacillus pectinilyticus]OCT14274.1 hypothetical protein A8709_25945 [Paenibacillus pectinilyticus]